MVDLFRDIPEDAIKRTLKNINNNLERLNPYDGHMINKHVDIQPRTLKMRLTLQDIQFATSYYDFAIAKIVITNLLKQSFDDKITEWLLSENSDKLVLQANYNKSIGYGYRKKDNTLYERLTKIRLILKKEYERDWGFRILTSYPIF